MYADLAILAIFVLVYSCTSRWFARVPFGGAILFAGFGLALGPVGLGALRLDIETEGLRVLAEVTLALVLFTDAANANLPVLARSVRLPQRLLLLGLPLTILLGFLAGRAIFPGLGLLEIAILATVLAPTDAALGKAVVTDPRVPDPIREGLNVESGLNDGICVPIFLLFLSLATSVERIGGVTGLALGLFAEEIGIGVAVGVSLTLFAGWLLGHCYQRGWIGETWMQLPVVALSLGSFALAQALGGSGFIAAFAGGLLFGWLARRHKHALLLAAEGTGDTLALVTWVVFGAAVVGQTAGGFTWEALLYALLSLTAIRMVPVFLALAGTGLKTGEKLFVGWFGPRGLASVVFGIMVIGAELPGGGTIATVAVLTISLSILAHGASAGPLAGLLARPETPRRP